MVGTVGSRRVVRMVADRWQPPRKGRQSLYIGFLALGKGKGWAGNKKGPEGPKKGYAAGLISGSDSKGHKKPQNSV